MKKFWIIILSVLTVVMTALGISCAKAPEGPTDNGFTWLETASHQREIGTQYNMSGIWGKYEGEYIAPEIAVTLNGATAEFDSENKILPLYELGEYKITLTFKFVTDTNVELTETKTFTVTSVDTTAPTIAKVFAGRLFSGEEIDLNTTFTAYDSVDKDDVTVSYVATSPTNQAVTIENGKFTATEFGYYTIEITATDSRNNTETKEFKLYIRDESIFESFRLEDESAQKGYSTNGREWKITEDKAQGDGGCLHFMSYKEYNHSYVKFENSVGVDWSKTNGLFFTIYNDSNADVYVEFGGMNVHNDIWGKNVNVAKLNKKSYNTVYVSQVDLAKYTSNGEKYLYAEICYERNGGTFTTGQINLYFDDVTFASETEAHEYQYNTVYNLTGTGGTTIDNQIYYQGEGYVSDRSAHVGTIGTWITFMFNGFAKNYASDGIREVQLWVYNPSDTYDYDITIGYFTDAVYAEKKYYTPSDGKGVTLKHGEWTKITLNTASWEDGVYIGVATNYELNQASIGSEKWKYLQENGLYFDGFKFIEYYVPDVENDETRNDNVIGDNY